MDDSYEDMTHDPEYHKWVEEMAEHCGCCPECHDVPCDEVLAGGLCTSTCTCDEYEFEDDGCYDDSDEDFLP